MTEVFEQKVIFQKSRLAYNSLCSCFATLSPSFCQFFWRRHLYKMIYYGCSGMKWNLRIIGDNENVIFSVLLKNQSRKEFSSVLLAASKTFFSFEYNCSIYFKHFSWVSFVCPFFKQHVIWYRRYFRVLHKLSILVTLLLLIRYCLKIHVHSYVKHHIIKHCQSNALIRTSLPQAPLQVC